MSTTIRTPSLSVALNGAPLSDVLSARVQTGFNLRVAEAQVVLTAPPSANIMPWDEIEITMGGTVGTAAVRFTGFFISYENQLYPKETVLHCKGRLGLAEVLEASTNIDMSTYPGNPGHYDQVMVSTVLYICGLAGAWTPSGEDSLPDIGGTGQLLGHTSWDDGFEWRTGESGLSFIERLDEVCLGWRTYDTFDGTIKRTQITCIPGASASATFTEHVDIYRATEETSIIGSRNRVVINGFPGRQEQVEISHTAEAENAFLIRDGNQWYLSHSLSSPMIEFQNNADKPAGYGLACEEVAHWLLDELNVYSEKVQLTTPRDDVIEPGDTIAIVSPTRLGISSRKFWVQEVDLEIGRQGAFSQVLTCITGIPLQMQMQTGDTFVTEAGDALWSE